MLESLRSRAGTVFAATALVTSFFGGFVLSGAADDRASFDVAPWAASGAAVGAFVALAVLTLAILWPYRMRFSVSASEMLRVVDERAAVDPVRAPEASSRA